MATTSTVKNQGSNQVEGLTTSQIFQSSSGFFGFAMFWAI
jgi:hypothetical protein